MRVQGEMTRNQQKLLRRRARVAGKGTGELHVLKEQEMEDGSMTSILANSSSKVGVGDWPLSSGP